MKLFDLINSPSRRKMHVLKEARKQLDDIETPEDTLEDNPLKGKSALEQMRYFES